MADRIRDALAAIAPEQVRNLSIIAHVDHGKTTLSDSLVSRAGLLNKEKAGTALTLDTDAQEQERGITINSTAVSLLYEVPKGGAEVTSSSSSSDDASDDDRRLHVGNLPFRIDEAAVREVLEPFGSINSLEHRAARGFAFVEYESADAVRTAIEASRSGSLIVNDRVLVVRRRGDSPRIRLRAACAARGLGVPEYSEIIPDVSSRGGEPTGRTVSVTIAGLGDSVMNRWTNDEPKMSLNGAKDAAAEAALEALSTVGGSGEAKEADDTSTEPMLVNLIDCPGHVDFSSEVTAALRLTDGALVIVDAIEGVCTQTETVLRQAIAEGVRIVLLVNKADRLFLERQLSPADAYDRIEQCIEEVNSKIRAFLPAGSNVADSLVSFEDGNVAVGSGYFGWGFTIDTLAALAAKGPSGVSALDVYAQFRGRSSKRAGGAGSSSHSRMKRAMISYALKPLHAFTTRIMGLAGATVDLDGVWRRLEVLGVTPPPVVTKDLPPKKVLKAVMAALMPVAESIIGMVHRRLPSPVEAQRTRAEHVYAGPLSDATGTGIRACDPDGPLSFYVAKLSAIPKAKGFYAFGRVFSGTVRAGQKVRVLLPEYTPVDATAAGGAGAASSSRKHAYEATVSRVVLMMGATSTSVGEARAGSVVSLMGVDHRIAKTATVIDGSHPEAFGVRTMRFAVSPVVRVAVTVVPRDAMPKVADAMRALAKVDPGVLYEHDRETGEHVLAGSGELHLDVCIKKLTAMTGLDVRAADPVVSHRESVTAAEGEAPIRLGKSTNKKNRVFVSCSVLDEDLIAKLEAGEIGPSTDVNSRVRELVDNHAWDPAEARKVWAFGPEGDSNGTNMLVDCSHSVQGLAAIKDSIVTAFHEVTRAGPLAREPMRGVRFEIRDAMAHADAAHRGAGQVVPAARRAMQAAALSAGPRFVEPLFEVTVTALESDMGSVYSGVAGRRGAVETTSMDADGSRMTITALVPVMTSFGLDAHLRGATSGRSFMSCAFYGWVPVPGEPAFDLSAKRRGGSGKDETEGDSSSAAAAVIAEVRERKGLDKRVAPASHYYDTL